MAESKQLGLFWEKQNLYFVQTIGKTPHLLFKIPVGKSSIESGNLTPGNVNTVAQIKQTLLKHNLIGSAVNLTLPTKDIIFRSFVIPWMQSGEIKGVVDFEASKYIPFSLNELSYAYHPITFTEDGIRRIRIIFVAIKKDALDNYVDILTQASLEVNLVEPSPISLIKILKYTNQLPEETTFAIIEKQELTGKITIINNEIPQFVREFQLKGASQNNQEETDPKTLMTRLINEIRISLDYFNRQDSSLQVAHLLLISSDIKSDLPQTLQHELSIPLKFINHITILNNALENDASYLSAYGIGLTPYVALQANINLSGKRVKASKTKTKKNLGKYNSIVMTTAVCMAIVGLTFFFSNKRTTKPKKEIAQLNSQLGKFKDSSTEKLKTKTNNLTKEITIYKELQLSSNLKSFLEEIPNVLPQGSWISSLTISYKPATKSKKDKKQKNSEQISINFDGYVYTEDANEQFSLVTTLVNNIKTHKLFKETFTNINLSSVSSKNLNSYDVTYFKIECD